MAKRSRRTRQAERARQTRGQPTTPTPEAKPVATAPAAPAPTEAAPKSDPGKSGKNTDFTADYGHVYTELRAIILISLLMILVIVALSYVVVF